MRISDWSSDVCSSDLFPHDSPRLVESKSFKLYLNSFSEERFASTDAVSKIMKADLAQAAGASVGIELCVISHQTAQEYGSLEGIYIDDADIEISTYETAPGLLQCLPSATVIIEPLVSTIYKRSEDRS